MTKTNCEKEWWGLVAVWALWLTLVGGLAYPMALSALTEAEKLYKN